jgi:hypothetical protein
MPEEEITAYDLKSLDLMFHPERHQHEDLQALKDCCTVDGAIDVRLFDEHSEYVDMGTNGGVRCDVRKGPCACGAWH